jgi:hypothetical protein
VELSLGWPPDLSWYKLLTDWGSLIGGLLALGAGIAAYVAGTKQARATREAADRQIKADERREQGRRQAYAAMGALEAQRIAAEAKRQIADVVSAVKEKQDPHIEVRYALSRIEVREVFRSEWEQLGSIEPGAAFSVYHLIDSIDRFNSLIAPREEIYAGAAQEFLSEIISKAGDASRRLTNVLEILPCKIRSFR